MQFSCTFAIIKNEAMNPKDVAFRTTIKPEDIDHVREIISSSGFFYDFEIPVAIELAEEGVREGEKSGYYFVFADLDGKAIAYTCYGHIAGTDAGYDLYWIATHDALRGTGIGKLLLEKTDFQCEYRNVTRKSLWRHAISGKIGSNSAAAGPDARG